MDENKPAARKIKASFKPPKKITEQYLRNAGLAYLQRYVSSVPNFRKLMTRRINRSCKHHVEQDPAKCMELLQRVVEDFVRLGYLNDDAYIKGVVYSARTKGLSKSAIVMKLQQKGIRPDALAETVAEENAQWDSAESEFIAALKTARRKKLGCFDTAGKDVNKQIAAMGRAGFDYQIIRRAMDISRDDAEELLHNFR